MNLKKKWQKRYLSENPLPDQTHNDDVLLGIMRKCFCNCLQSSKQRESAKYSVSEFLLRPHSIHITDEDFENYLHENAATEKEDGLNGRTDLCDEITQFNTSSNIDNSTMIVTGEPGDKNSENPLPDQTHLTSIERENHRHKKHSKRQS